MIPLFLGLTLVNLLVLGAALALGYLRSADDIPSASRHILTGTLSALVCCAVHCIVFTYFVATAKWLRHAVTVKRLDPSLLRPTRSFRAQAFPAAMAAIAVVFLTAFAGAGADNYGGRWGGWHHALAVSGVLVNLLAAAVEYRAIARNGRLIDDVLARIGARETAGAGA